MSKPVPTPPTCRITVKATPNARANEIRGFVGDVLQVRLKAPPVDGKANEALVRLVAERLGLPRAAVTLDHGATARRKLLRIDGMPREDAIARLSVSM